MYGSVPPSHVKVAPDWRRHWLQFSDTVGRIMNRCMPVVPLILGVALSEHVE